MIRRMIGFIRDYKERRRRRMVARFMFEQSLSSYDHFMGWDKDD